MKNILIICTANKTRSVMAMEVAKFLAVGKNYNFTGAGIAVMGSEIDDTAKQILSEMGIESTHTPTPLEGLNISAYDEIHVMTRRHKTALCSLYAGGDIEDRIRILDIEDPYGKGKSAYRDCLDRLKEYYEKFLKS
jgi:protein-tyrosine-phosphatase